MALLPPHAEEAFTVLTMMSVSTISALTFEIKNQSDPDQW